MGRAGIDIKIKVMKEHSILLFRKELDISISSRALISINDAKKYARMKITKSTIYIRMNIRQDSVKLYFFLVDSPMKKAAVVIREMRQYNAKIVIKAIIIAAGDEAIISLI